MSGFRFDEVYRGPELERVLRARQRPIPVAAPELCEQLTRALANVPVPYPFRKASDRLFPAQALALAEVAQHQRLTGVISVGGGKMLTAYLIFVLLGAKRPLYLLPKSMEAETRAEVLRYSADWGHGACPASRVAYLGYEKLSTPNSATKYRDDGSIERLGILERIRPDVIVADEAHKLSNRGAIGWKRLHAYLQGSKATFIPLSGSLFRTSLDQAAHILFASLGEDSPIPNDFEELLLWASALNPRPQGARAETGALVELLPEGSRRALSDLQILEKVPALLEHLGERMLRTPGVIGSSEDPLGIPLSVDAEWVANEDPKIAAEMLALLDGDEDRPAWSLPDGDLVIDALSLAHHRHTYNLGFWSRPEPAPPESYRSARLEWAKAARDRLRHNHLHIDSEANLKAAIEEGHFKDLRAPLAAWKAEQEAYTLATGLREPPSVAQFFSDEALESVARWLDREGTGIVWCGYIPLAQRIARALGLPYFGAGKVDGQDRPITQLRKGEACVASIAACGTGTNLQHFHSKGLWLDAPTEQPLGRTHRPGQTEERVQNWVYLPGRAQFDRYWHAYRAAAAFASPISGVKAKLVLASSDIPRPESPQIRRLSESPRWRPHKNSPDV